MKVQSGFEDCRILVLLIVVTIWPTCFVQAQDKTRVIPYQGMLTTQAGEALTPSSPITLVFRLYETPVGGAVSGKKFNQMSW